MRSLKKWRFLLLFMCRLPVFPDWSVSGMRAATAAAGSWLACVCVCVQCVQCVWQFYHLATDLFLVFRGYNTRCYTQLQQHNKRGIKSGTHTHVYTFTRCMYHIWYVRYMYVSTTRWFWNNGRWEWIFLFSTRYYLFWSGPGHHFCRQKKSRPFNMIKKKKTLHRVFLLLSVVCPFLWNKGWCCLSECVCVCTPFVPVDVVVVLFKLVFDSSVKCRKMNWQIEK